MSNKPIPERVKLSHCPTWRHVETIMKVFEVSNHVCLVEELPDNRGFYVEIYECVDR